MNDNSFTNVTDKGIQHIVRHCRNLEELYLLGFRLQRLTESCLLFSEIDELLPKLKFLEVSCSYYITNEFLEKLKAKFKDLRIISGYGKYVPLLE